MTTRDPRRAVRPALLIALVLLLGGLTSACRGGEDAPTDAPAAEEGGFRGQGPTGTLRLLVTPGLVPVAERQTAAFMRRYSGARITLTPSTARESVAALAAGETDAVILDRPLNDEERRVLETNEIVYREILIGTDAVAFVVPAANAARGLDVAALRRLLQGEPVAWADLADSTGGGLPPGNAALALAPLNTGAVELLTTTLLPGRTPPRPAHAATDEEDVLSWVARTPGGLGVVPMVTFRADSTGRLRTLALPDSTGRLTLPTQRTVDAGTYPLRQPVTLIVVSSRNSLNASFATFARDVMGQEAVLRAGLVPAVMPVREIILN